MACTVFHLSLSSNFFQVSSSIEFIPPDSFFLASGIQTEKKALGKVAGFEQELSSMKQSADCSSSGTSLETEPLSSSCQ